MFSYKLGTRKAK